MTPPPYPEPQRTLDLDGLRRLARSLLRDAGPQVDDVVHDAWLRAATSAPASSASPGWWTTVLRNVHRSRRRAERRRTHHEQALAATRPTASTAQDPAHAAARLETARAVLDAVGSLDEPYRSAITRRYLDGSSPREIAARTNTPLRTVHTHLQRGLAMLRARLQSHFGKAGDDRAWMLALLPMTTMTTKKATISWLGAALATVLLGTAWALAIRSETTPPPIRPESSPRTAAALATEQSESDPRTEPPARRPSAEVSTAPPPPAATIIRGMVIDLDGNPVAGVAVANNPGRFTLPGIAAAQTTESDAEGRFELRFADTLAGQLREVDADWIGLYEPELWGLQGADTPALTLVVTRTQQLRGVVVDASTGAPLGDVDLNASATLPSAAGFDRDLSHSHAAPWRTTSNSDGSFELDLPLLPDLQLHGALPGYEHLHLDITLPSASLQVSMQPSGALLSGQVLDAAGRPAAGAAVLCGAAAALADELGRFTIDLTHVNEDPQTQQHRLLVAARYGELPARLWGPEQTWRDAASWPHPVVLRLGDPPTSIHGRVAEPDGSPVRSVRVRALDQEPLGSAAAPRSSWRTVEHLARSSISIEGSETIFEENSQTAEAGTFTVDGLQRRAYRLCVEDPATLRAMVTDPVPAGTADLLVQMPAERMWDSVGGIVVDRRGTPVADCTVRIVRHFQDIDGLPHLDIVLRTDAEGRFRSPGPVAAATHAVLAQAPSTVQPQRFLLADQPDPGAMRLVVPVSIRARVIATQTSRAASTLTLYDADDQLLAVLVRSGGQLTASSALTLADGRSPVFETLDSAAEAVLVLNSGERLRRPIELTRPASGDVLELRF